MPYVYDADKDEATYVEEEPSFDAAELLAIAESESKLAAHASVAIDTD